MIKKFLNSKFKKDLSFSYITQALKVGFGFIQLFLINRYFGVEVYGQLTIIVSAAGIFSVFLTARSSEAVTRFFTREIIKNNLENAKLVLFIGFAIDLVTALILVLVIFLFSDLISTTFIKNTNLNTEVFLYSFVVFFGFLRGTLFGYFQSKEMFSQINSIRIFESSIKVLALIVTIFMIRESSLVEIIYIFIFASFLSLLYSVIIFVKYYKTQFKNIELLFNKEILGEYWSFNIKTFSSSSLKAGAANIDNLVLGYFSNMETVGIYQTVKRLLSPVSFVVQPFTTLTLSKIVKFYEKKEFLLLHNLIKNLTIKLVIISIILIIILFMIIKPFLLFQNIHFNVSLMMSFILLSIYYILPTMIWWGRNFIIMHNPMLPVYSNLLLSINSIWIPVVLFQLNYFDALTTISMAILLAYIPSWLFAPIVYLKFMKKKGVI